ncbi:MAG: methylmalonyl Co-A mutase-associated GTPase MeaB [Hyphomicrobiaceae bacterium]|nr:methylmalonyl Co-A mutase-associated GTPase MeaB [Hyphomicrobiaceae bacterium]
MNASGNLARLIEGIACADTRLLARAISHVENETETGWAILRAVRGQLGHAAVVGITGAPGAGKSTLVSALIGAARSRDRRVAVVAIDPSSPISGGAVLGDRVRMEKHSGAKGVYIRSLASRGHSGGLCRAAARVIDVLDAAAFDLIIVETVGAGQAEVDVASLADTVVVVCPPGLGDEVQAVKAGLMEIADIYAVSKGDLPLADKTEHDLRALIRLRPEPRPSLVRTVAQHNKGVAELLDAIDRHRRIRPATGPSDRVRRLLVTATAAAVADVLTGLEDPVLEELCAALAQGDLAEREAVGRAAALAADALRPSSSLVRSPARTSP